MKFSYPAIFYPWGEGEGYTVEVPDLHGCVTEGDTMADAILMAADAASLWVLSELEEGRPAPVASKMSDVQAEEGGVVSLIALDIDAYAEKYGKKAVRKNLTVPAWLNTFAEAHDINFSKALQSTLSAMYERYNEPMVDCEIYDKTAHRLSDVSKNSTP